MAGFWNQANALFWKNISYHKRHVRSNLRIILFPVIVFTVIAVAEHIYKAHYKPQMMNPERAFYFPNNTPPLLQVPYPDFRAVKSKNTEFEDLPDESCKKMESCPVTILVTGENRTLGEGVMKTIITSSYTRNVSDGLPDFAQGLFGTSVSPGVPFSDQKDKFYVQAQCSIDSVLPGHSPTDSIKCATAWSLWRMNYSDINHELYKGYLMSSEERKINEIMGAYDFRTSSAKNFDVTIAYNATYEGRDITSPLAVRVQRAENMVANGFLQFLLGPATRMILESVSVTPELNHYTDLSADDLELLVVFYTWMILQLLPVMVETLVYEKQQKLRIMMGMHGLGNGAYWFITYMYFLIVSSLYVCCYVVSGILTSRRIFTMNSLSLQCTFYFIYINLQISTSFLLAQLFKSVRSASVIGFLFVFGAGLAGATFFSDLVKDVSVNKIFPAFALYRGIKELSDYSNGAVNVGTFGIQWRHLKNSSSGMREVFIVMTVTWLLFLLIAYFVDKISSSTLTRMFRKRTVPPHSFTGRGPNVFVQMEKEDMTLEVEKVKRLQIEPNPNYSTICCDLKKVYPGKDGTPDKVAVKGAYLALPRGECFGILGPNGAGKTTFINMMIGLLKPTSGTAFIEGLNLQTQMNMIHSKMGVCPQADLLWDTLTAREHLLFYGRLKNLTGSTLTHAVNDALKRADLSEVRDKLSVKYSGGMKRRLSVAISLIGDPKVVYLDEPSSGLDPASRKKLWQVVRQAKTDKTIVLTTHSMEEAEQLCDRIGIFVDGNFQCLGSPDELKNRYGGFYILTMTTSARDVEEVEGMVKRLSPSARRSYRLSGTQKFEMPKREMKKSDIFGAVKYIKQRFPVQIWGVTETTMEDVFIKVAVDADSSIV
ncbi:ABC transporter A family member 10-like isoform X2 [Henckelia pumila]|uniref:ABC transporter A family member 10-like isoform X2 n=1 Tax=Henckelia pumila TaxID=405737 RepID=UPI003C6E947B